MDEGLGQCPGEGEVAGSNLCSDHRTTTQSLQMEIFLFLLTFAEQLPSLLGGPFNQLGWAQQLSQVWLHRDSD